MRKKYKAFKEYMQQNYYNEIFQKRGEIYICQQGQAKLRERPYL